MGASGVLRRKGRGRVSGVSLPRIRYGWRGSGPRESQKRLLTGGGLRDLPSAFCLPLPRTGLSHSLTETISLVHFRRTRAWLHLCCACHPPGHYLQGHVNSPKFQTFPYPKESGPSCQVCRAECLFGTLSITVKIVENDKFLNKCVLRTRVCILFNNFGGRDRP